MTEAAIAEEQYTHTSRYTLRDKGPVLTIAGVGRTTVTVEHEGPRFRVTHGGYFGPSEAEVGLFDYFALSKLISRGVS